MLVAPFPYFGGKRAAAALVWRALGNVDNYVEPFFGSGAVLLGRPGAARVETVNDADGLLANVWRSMRAAPDAVAEHADWPVNEADLHARHLWLLGQRERITERLMADPDFYDAKAAGWWVWGACAWIGSGWCSGRGPWQAVDGVLTNVKASGNNGRGINRQLPHLGDNGRGINSDRGASMAEWFGQIAARLRDVRVACGDWSRVLGPSVSYAHPTVKDGGWAGIFLIHLTATWARRICTPWTQQRSPPRSARGAWPMPVSPARASCSLATLGRATRRWRPKAGARCGGLKVRVTRAAAMAIARVRKCHARPCGCRLSASM